jgi:flagellin-like protein
MYVLNRHFNNRAVSQVIAALLLIAIAVAAAILLYVFAIGLLGSLGSSGGQQTKQQLILEAYHWDFTTPPGEITGTLRNVGSSSIDATTTDVFVNGVASSTPGLGGDCATATLTPGGSCNFDFTPGGTGTDYVAGAAYPLKLVTSAGGVFSYSVISGGSS